MDKCFNLQVNPRTTVLIEKISNILDTLPAALVTIGAIVIDGAGIYRRMAEPLRPWNFVRNFNGNSAFPQKEKGGRKLCNKFGVFALCLLDFPRVSRRPTKKYITEMAKH